MKRTFLNKNAAEWLALAPEVTINGIVWFVRPGCIEYLYRPDGEQ